MPPLTITAIAASILALIFIRLSFAVITFRKRHRVSLGSGGHDDLERAIRAQGNFAEYVPLSVLLLACLEWNGAPAWLVAIPAVAVIGSRLFHAQGMHDKPPVFRRRVLGMQLTLTSLLALAVLNLGWIGLKLMG